MPVEETSTRGHDGDFSARMASEEECRRCASQALCRHPSAAFAYSLLLDRAPSCSPPERRAPGWEKLPPLPIKDRPPSDACALCALHPTLAI